MLNPVLATIPPPPGNVIELGPLTVHYYGIAIAIGALVAISLTRRRYAAMGGDPDLADRVALWAILAGLVGARVFYVLPRFQRFVDDPVGIIRVWEGGLVFFGGIGVGAATGIYLFRRWGGDLPAAMDSAAPAIPLAQVFGRWGNYFNQELYGTPTDLPWALEIEQDGQIVSTVHPTFLYEMLANLVLVGALIAIGRTGRLRRGSLLFLYGVGYGIIRFAIEFIRTDERAFTWIFTANQWVSLAIMLLGAVGLWWWHRRPEPAADATTDAEHDAAIDGEREVVQGSAAEHRDEDAARVPLDGGGASTDSTAGPEPAPGTDERTR
jgi:prolipoprotein diacylglyceryl transferase